MFSIFGKNVRLAELMDDFYDVHSHLLCGVDDGSQSPAVSFKLLKRLQKMGLRGSYLTPHVYTEVFPDNTSEYLRKQFELFKKQECCNSELELRLGAEYYMDSEFERYLADPLLLKDNHILVEFDLCSMPISGYEMLSGIIFAGYTPIIAHPERYRFAQDDDMETVRRFVGMGCKLQLNLLTLTGWQGLSCRRLAKDMLKEGLYDFIATDMHSFSQIEEIESAKIPLSVAQEVEKLKLNNKTLF